MVTMLVRAQLALLMMMKVFDEFLLNLFNTVIINDD